MWLRQSELLFEISQFWQWNILGPSERVIYPYGAYFIFSSPLNGLPENEAKVVKSSIQWSNELDDEDENFLVALMDEIDIGHDESEVGYPEKLASVANDGWHVTVAHRAGRYAANELLLSDEQLVEEAKKKEGGANYYMYCTVSPKYQPSWEKFKADAKLVLLGSKAWSRIFFEVIKSHESTKTDAIVSVHLYNLMNIVFSLARLCGSKDYHYMPVFQLVSTCADEVVLYIGTVAWNGQPVSISGGEWVDKVYGSVNDFTNNQHFGEQFTKEDLACSHLGLSYIVFEVRRPGTSAEEATVLGIYRGRLTRTPIVKSKLRSIAEFCSENAEFCNSLVRDLGEFSLGMVSAV